MASLTTMPSTLKNMPHSALAPLSTASSEMVERHDTAHTDQCPAPVAGTEQVLFGAALKNGKTVTGTPQKIFRNSAIMDEYAGYRPKLFHTATTSPNPSMIGNEREFPPPNNDSKHKRSSDNATTIEARPERAVAVREKVQDSLTGETKEMQYTQCKIVGNGTFGVVFQTKLSPSGEDAAIKRVLQDKLFRDDVYTELKVESKMLSTKECMKMLAFTGSLAPDDQYNISYISVNSSHGEDNSIYVRLKLYAGQRAPEHPSSAGVQTFTPDGPKAAPFPFLSRGSKADNTKKKLVNVCSTRTKVISFPTLLNTSTRSEHNIRN
ncbi:glycogen synthase kinase 3 [Vermiconidia calcicola]|uniref:Glycogen synthase kinase 3 n=1 Tax=Vermiconidia calcicola TaxID=1690605 RepID=A0ACC3NVG2_9PEZI|nr:glycogen synthase kinase 3 [Vermiconidia calcicola]